MSVLVSTSLCTFINDTGLKMECTLRPTKSLRIHEVFTDNVKTNVQTNISWMTEWVYLILYGSLQQDVCLTLKSREHAKICLHSTGPMIVDCKWVDPSVSWKQELFGSWSIEPKEQNNIIFQAHFQGYEFDPKTTPRTVSGLQITLAPLEPLEPLQLPQYIMHYRKNMSIDDICHKTH